MGIAFIDPKDVRFQRTKGGFLSLKIGRKKPYPRVHLYRVFPLSEPGRLISVRDEKDNEIGMIDTLADFPTDATRLIEEELNRRYFSPEIRKLISIKEEFGYTYWDAETEAGIRRFTVKGGDNNVTHISHDTLMIIDVDGNRYTFHDFEKADSKYLKIIDTML